MSADLAIVYQAPAALHPHPRNPRTHSPDQVRQIIAAIREFGWTNPIIVDEQNVILAGHGRWDAARTMGLDRVPTVSAAGMTEAQKRAYIIADNKLAANAGWDASILAAEINFLQAEDFELGVMGFSDDEMLRIRDDADEAIFAHLASDAAANPPPPAAEPSRGFAPPRRAEPAPAPTVIPAASPEGEEGFGDEEGPEGPEDALPAASEPQRAATPIVSTQAPAQMVPISMMVPPHMRDRILEAVRAVKARDNLETTGEALFAIADEWLKAPAQEAAA